MPPAVARVAVNRPCEPLDYALPDGLQAAARPGMRVLVPLRQQRATGVIVELADRSEIPNLKPIQRLLDDVPVFDEPMLELTRWIAEYYCCSWGEALACAAPPGSRWTLTERYRLAEPLPMPLDELLQGLRGAPRQTAIVRHLAERGSATPRTLQDATGGAPVHATLRALLDAGCVVRAPHGHRAIAEPKALLEVEPAVTADALRQQAVALSKPAPRQAAVLHAVAERTEPWLAGELVAATASTYATLRALEQKSLLRLVSREQRRTPDAADAVFRGAAGVALTGEQTVALGLVREMIDADAFGVLLLEGVTGSGKTEVYLRAAEHALACDKDVIVLVPEISLTAQTVARFQAKFGDQVALLHSRLSAGERADQWRALQAREMRIAVGPRSAVFAPLPRAGLLIVDEEHDAAYKQQDTPRYHARDVAVMRAHQAGAVAVLGSATPSLETMANVAAGKYRETHLSERPSGAPLPPVEIVDLREALRGQRGERTCTDQLLDALGAVLHRGEQAIVFLNRRGFAPTLLCPKCGLAQGCEHCSVSMIWHQRDGVVRCHYCNAEHPVPTACRYCRGDRLVPLGAGTEKVERELGAFFPSARIARMDTDTTARKGMHEKILGAFGRGELDMLVGTQMIAKGLDFPNVTLVGVISVDTALNLPDLRAVERIAQMLQQVAGRSGRGPRGGRVIFQTYRPDHYAVQAAARHDYRTFVAHELELRRELGYPPWRHLGRVVFEGRSQSAVVRAAKRMSRLLHRTGLEVLGPAPAPLARVQGQYRWHCQVLSPRPSAVRDALRAVSAAPGSGTNGVRTTVDMDALSLL